MESKITIPFLDLIIGPVVSEHYKQLVEEDKSTNYIISKYTLQKKTFYLLKQETIRNTLISYGIKDYMQMAGIIALYNLLCIHGFNITRERFMQIMKKYLPEDENRPILLDKVIEDVFSDLKKNVPELKNHELVIANEDTWGLYDNLSSNTFVIWQKGLHFMPALLESQMNLIMDRQIALKEHQKELDKRKQVDDDAALAQKLQDAI